MTRDEIQLLRASCQRLEPRMDSLLVEFYTRFLPPRHRRRALFPSDLSSQMEHLRAALTHIVNNADRLDAIAPDLDALGRRHDGYGIRPQDLRDFRTCLFEAIRSVTIIWSKEETAAWNAALDEVEHHMFANLQDQTARPAA